MVVDGGGADEQVAGDFLVGGALGGEACDLSFLRGQVVACFDGPFAGTLAGRRELGPGAIGEGLHPELHKQLVGAA